MELRMTAKQTLRVVYVPPEVTGERENNIGWKERKKNKKRKK